MAVRAQAGTAILHGASLWRAAVICVTEQGSSFFCRAPLLRSRQRPRDTLTQRRQYIGFEPRIALEPRNVARRRMRQWNHLRAEVPPPQEGIGQCRTVCCAESKPLRILSDQQREPD